MIACSQTLYFLFQVNRVRVIKEQNRGGFIDHQRSWVGVGERENSSLFFFLALRARYRFLQSRARQCFRKERKEK